MVKRICCVMIYFMVLFNSVEFGGHPLFKGMLFGICDALGVLIVERVTKYATYISGFNVIFPAIAILSTLLKIDIPDQTLYIVFCLQVFATGFMHNLSQMLQYRCTKPLYRAISLELNQATAEIFTSVVPIMSKMSEPWPTGSYWVLGFIGMIMVNWIGEDPHNEKDLNKSKSESSKDGEELAK